MPHIYQDILKRLAVFDVENLNVENKGDTRLLASLSQVRADELSGDVIRAFRDLWREDARFVAGKDDGEIGLRVVRNRREMVRR